MNIKNILFAAAAAMALTACHSDDEQQSFVSQFPEDGVMRFTTNLNDAATVQTRSTITTSDLATFKVKIVNPASDTYSYFEAVNLVSGEWTPANRMLWQNETAPISMTAAYLGSHDLTDTEFTSGANLAVASDQTTQAKLNAQDLLTMPTKSIDKPSTETTLLSGGKLVINLYHGLSKLDVTLELANEFYNVDPKLNKASDITDFTISGTNTGYTFQPMQTANTNYGTVSVTASTAADIQPFQSEFTAATDANKHSTATYESVVVPQEIAAGTLTVSFKIGTRSFSWTNTQAYTLEQGKLYTLPLTVGSDIVTLGANALTVKSWGSETGDNLTTE